MSFRPNAGQTIDQLADASGFTPAQINSGAIPIRIAGVDDKIFPAALIAANETTIHALPAGSGITTATEFAATDVPNSGAAAVKYTLAQIAAAVASVIGSSGSGSSSGGTPAQSGSSYPSLVLSGATPSFTSTNQKFGSGALVANNAVCTTHFASFPFNPDNPTGGPADTAMYSVGFWFKSGGGTLPSNPGPFLTMGNDARSGASGQTQTVAMTGNTFKNTYSGNGQTASKTGAVNIRDGAWHFFNVQSSSYASAVFIAVFVDGPAATDTGQMGLSDYGYFSTAASTFVLDTSQLAPGDIIDDIQVKCYKVQNTVPTAAQTRDQYTQALFPLDGNGTGS